MNNLQLKLTWLRLKLLDEKHNENFTDVKNFLFVERCLEVFTNVVQEKDQKYTILWKRVHKHFEESKKFK